MIAYFAQETPVQIEIHNGANLPLLIISGLSAVVSAVAVIVSVVTAVLARRDRDAEVAERKAAQQEIRDLHETSKAEALQKGHAIDIQAHAEWADLKTAEPFRELTYCVRNHSAWPVTDVEIYARYPICDDDQKPAPMTHLQRSASVNPNQGGSTTQTVYIIPTKLDDGTYEAGVATNEPIPVSAYFTDRFGHRWRRDTDGSLGLVKATPVFPKVDLICRGDFGHWRWLNSGRVDVLPVTVMDIVRSAVVEC